MADGVSLIAVSMPEVEAVIFLGGLARGYCDDRSDLDISIIVNSSDRQRGRHAFERLTKEIEMRTGIETDIVTHSLDDLKA